MASHVACRIVLQTTFLLTVCCLASLAPTSADLLKLYVSPKGNDAWSGRLPAPANGDGPFATLTRARDEIRAAKATGALTDGAVVFVREGVYDLPETFLLTEEDSGSPSAPIVYRAYENEKPVLTGARRIKPDGFGHYKGEILQCDLKGTPLENVAFRQLFFRNERQIMARYPNYDPSDPHGGTWAYILDVDGDKIRDRFHYTPDVEKNWTRLEDAQVCIHPGYDWAWNILPIKAVNRGTSEIILAKSASYDLRVGDRYYVQNLLEELDAPSEWYLDRSTSTLYFWPPADIKEGDVCVPVLDSVVAMKGASHIIVRGFFIEMSASHAVVIENCDNCMIAASTIRNCGGWGVYISGGHKSGAFGNDIYATGAGGVFLGGGDRDKFLRGDNFAINNYIHHIAAFYKTYNTGVNCTGLGNLVSHNLIHDTYHAAIIVGGNDHVIEYNHIHHTNLGSADTGGLYMSSRNYTMRGTVIRYNLFHHIGGFGKTNSWQPVRDGKVEFKYPHFSWGIYLDAPETGVTVYGNVLYSVPICGMFNHSGKDNTWENNIIVDAPAFRASVWRDRDLFETSWAPLRKARQQAWPGLQHYPELARYDEKEPRFNTMFNCRFVRNIVYYTTQGSARLREANRSSWDGGQLVWTYVGHKDDFPEFEFDYNLVYAPPGVEPRVELTLEPSGRELLTWQQWRQTGKDQHSIFADPLFVDPEKHDYRLRPDSPAFKLGFKPIPMDRIGPYKDELRASWPIVEAPGAAALGDFTTVRYFTLPGCEPVPAREFVPRNGAPNAFLKLSAGGPVTVACFAGGNHAAGVWRSGVLDWLRKRYPSAQITDIDASICGCVRGSPFSVYRFGHDVLAHKPDLVFLDFAADDAENDINAIWAAVEGIVRQTWKANPHTDIIFLYAFRPGFEQSYSQDISPQTVSAYERLADHYGIPSINMGYRIAQLHRDGRLLITASQQEAEQAKDKTVFSSDGVHTSPQAAETYVQVITEHLAKLAQATPAASTPHTLPPPFRKNNLENATLAPITSDMLSGNWQRIPPDNIQGRSFAKHFDEVWFTNNPGSTLTFKFRGTAASIFDLIGPDTGRVKVTVDGKEMGVHQRVDRWCYYQRLSAIPIASGLEDAEHVVTIELLPDVPDRSVPIAEAQALNRYNPKDFEGVALRIGWIRLVGDLIR